MSMWMTSGASRLKAKQGQTFAARAQQRSRVVGSGRLLSGRQNRRILGRSSTSQHRKRLVVGEKATIDSVLPPDREEGITVSVGLDDLQNGRSQQYHHQRIQQSVRSDPTDSLPHVQHHYSSQRIDPRQLCYQHAVTRPAAQYIPSPYAGDGLSHFGHPPDPRPHHVAAPPSQQWEQTRPEYLPPDYCQHGGHTEISHRPMQVRGALPMATPIQYVPAEEHSNHNGQVGDLPSLTPFQQYLRSPARQLFVDPLQNQDATAYVLPRHLPSAPHHSSHFASLRPMPEQYAIASAPPRDPDHDLLQIQHGSSAVDRGLKLPARRKAAPPQSSFPIFERQGLLRQHSAASPSVLSRGSPINRKRLFESVGNGWDSNRGHSFGHDGNETSSVQQQKKARIDRGAFGYASRDAITSFGKDDGPVKQDAAGGIAKFQRPTTNNVAKSAPPFAHADDLVSRSYDRLASATRHHALSHLPNELPTPASNGSSMPAQRPPFIDRRGEPIRYFKEGIEVDITGVPLGNLIDVTAGAVEGF